MYVLRLWPFKTHLFDIYDDAFNSVVVNVIERYRRFNWNLC